MNFYQNLFKVNFFDKLMLRTYQDESEMNKFLQNMSFNLEDQSKNEKILDYHHSERKRLSQLLNDFLFELEFLTISFILSSIIILGIIYFVTISYLNLGYESSIVILYVLTFFLPFAYSSILKNTSKHFEKQINI